MKYPTTKKFLIISVFMLVLVFSLLIARQIFAQAAYHLINPVSGTIPENTAGTTAVAILIGRAIALILMSVGAIALLFFVYGGFNLLASGGSSEKVQRGKQILTYSTIGLFIILLSFITVNYIFKVFTGVTVTPTYTPAAPPAVVPGEPLPPPIPPTPQPDIPPEPNPEPPTPGNTACSDFKDNDGDGRVDFNPPASLGKQMDYGCRSADDSTETDYCEFYYQAADTNILTCTQRNFKCEPCPSYPTASGRNKPCADQAIERYTLRVYGTTKIKSVGIQCPGIDCPIGQACVCAKNERIKDTNGNTMTCAEYYDIVY